MTRALPRTSFNSPTLVRVLADLAADGAGPKRSEQSFAERLAQWLDVNDAIALSTALKSVAAGGTEAGAVAASPADGALRAEFARVRVALIGSIGTDGGKARSKAPTPAPGASIEEAADFSPYRRYYLALQREMDASIGPLRTKVRAALARHSPALRRLALLDAALDQALGGRERSLLTTVPSRLEKRFAQLRQAHRAALADPAADDPERWGQPGGWLAVFGKDMRDVLLAELDVRLQPVLGLLEALGTAAAPLPSPEGAGNPGAGPSSSQEVTRQQ